MVVREILVFAAFIALVLANEIEDAEQKKRGAGKGSNLNAIPTGVQKPEYTYSIYSQSPNSQQSTSYQTQVPNSFYPNQASQYYTSANSPSESQYPQQPQINLIPPASSSQFLPVNFVQNPGYQSKLFIPSKGPNGNIQLAFIQQPYQTPLSSYPQLFSPNTNHLSPYQNLLGSLPQQFNVAPNYQPFSLGSPYLGQPSTMLLLAQPNPSLFNNFLYPNPGQSFYNYYPTNSQTKYNLSYGSSQPLNDYEKVQGSLPQAASKEDNDISAHNSEYISPSESTNYKNVYTSRSSYSKL